MFEEIPDNELSLNQLASQKLREANVQPESWSLYVLQLARWGLSRLGASNQIHPDLWWAMDLRLDDLLGHEPRRVMRENFEENPSERNLEASDLESLSPIDAAREILAFIHNQQPVANLAWPGNIFPGQTR